MKFYEVVRHNRRLKSEQTPFYRGGKIGKISFFIAVAKFAKSPFYRGGKIGKISDPIGISGRLVSLFCIRFFQVVCKLYNRLRLS